MASPSPLGSNSPQLPLVFEKINTLTLDGLRHGHFDITITCEVINTGKRRITIKAGNSHQYVISKDELEV